MNSSSPETLIGHFQKNIHPFTKSWLPEDMVLMSTWRDNMYFDIISNLKIFLSFFLGKVIMNSQDSRWTFSFLECLDICHQFTLKHLLLKLVHLEEFYQKISEYDFTGMTLGWYFKLLKDFYSMRYSDCHGNQKEKNLPGETLLPDMKIIWHKWCFLDTLSRFLNNIDPWLKKDMTARVRAILYYMYRKSCNNFVLSI